MYFPSILFWWYTVLKQITKTDWYTVPKQTKADQSRVSTKAGPKQGVLLVHCTKAGGPKQVLVHCTKAGYTKQGTLYQSRPKQYQSSTHQTMPKSPQIKGLMPNKNRTSRLNAQLKLNNTSNTRDIQKTAERVAVVPGSFDPLTHGHINIIERALGIFDKVVVGVLMNPSKTALFSDRERVRLIRDELNSKYSGRLEVLSFSGLLVEFVRQVKSRVVIRGLRAISDFDYEAQMSLINHKLDPDVETLFLTAREEHAYISSTIVKQVALLGGDVTDMVPERVAEALSKKRSGRRDRL